METLKMVEVRTRGVAWLRERLPSMHKALGSISTSYLYSPNAGDNSRRMLSSRSACAWTVRSCQDEETGMCQQWAM